ncbi:MAG TPA: hypothetical protein VFJ20_16440 [Gemmatimonadaceae bacterium]|nr:hypothetical protein [Gemmatimonadaceae bacterium]
MAPLRPARPIGVRHGMGSRIRLASIALCCLTVVSPLVWRLTAQLIQVKTLPIADGDQWRIFPSANSGMGDVSIALADSLLDPFVNPAKGSRMRPKSGGAFFGSPAFYSVSQNAGGGRTFPVGGILRSGSTFGAIAFAYQEIDDVNSNRQFTPPPPVLRGVDGSPVTIDEPSRQNQFAFASIGRVFAGHDLSVAGGVQWSRLHDIDGVDLLYAGSAGIDQHGNAVDARLGVTKDWVTRTGTRTAEAILLRNGFDMTHDVTWADQVWDANTRTFTTRARVDHNLDRTDTWGLHLGYSQPAADSGWRVGAIATANLMSHPKLPDYQIARVAVIPWDPGHTAAYDLGVGVSKVHGPTTLGFDAIFEPIATHTWGEAHGPTPTQSGGTIPDGGKTTENHFRFSNSIVRGGVGHDLDLGSQQTLRLQLGIALRSIDYSLRQLDHVAEAERRQHEHWTEWTRTWGLGLHFSDLEIRYAGRRATGTGRPGILPSGGVIFDAPVALSAGSNILAAPTGPLTLTGVAVTTHQISVSLPIR